MQWWGLVLGAGVGIALAALMTWRGRRALRRRQAEEIQDAAWFGWVGRSAPGDNGNENRF